MLVAQFSYVQGQRNIKWRSISDGGGYLTDFIIQSVNNVKEQ